MFLAFIALNCLLGHILVTLAAERLILPRVARFCTYVIMPYVATHRNKIRHEAMRAYHDF